MARGFAPPNRFAPKQRTAADHRTELTTMLWQCRPGALDSYDIDFLCGRYSKLPRKEVEYLLTVVRQKRAGEER